MDVQLNIDPAELAKKITEALTTQAFSEMFKKAVEEELSNLTKKSSYSSDSVLKSVIHNFFSQKMREILETEYNDKAKEICRKAITDEKIEELASTFVGRIRLSEY